MKSKYIKKPRKDSTNSSRIKNINAAKDIKEHILNTINNNNQNIIYRNNDIYNKKKVIIYIEEGNKIFYINFYFNKMR